MPLDFHRDDSRRRVVITGIGIVTIDEWAACVARQITEDAWSYTTLYDFTGAALLPSSDELPSIARTILELTTQRGRRGAVAMVARPGTLAERVQSYASLASILPHPTKAFESRESAEQWLDEQAKP